MDTAQFPNLFLDRESSDVQLHVYTRAEYPEAVIPAHSLVLRTAGKAFRTLLENAVLKEDEGANVQIIVKGDLQDAIRFLRYLYTRELEDLELNAYISLLHTAHLYQLHELTQLCNERITGKLTPLTVCRTFRSMKNLASERLLVRCKDLLLDCAFLIFWKNLHLTLDEKTMSFLFASERLNFLDQEQAFSALKRWGCARRAFRSQNGKDNDQQVENLLNQMEKSLAVNASPWFLRLWTNVDLSSKASDMWNKNGFSRGASTLWKYWSTGKEDRAAQQYSGAYLIRTEPRLTNKITNFANVFFLVEDKCSLDGLKITDGSTRLMSVSVTRDILLAGFTIQVRDYREALITALKIRESISFHLNAKELVVNNYKTTVVRRLNYEYPEKQSGDLNVSNLKINLRTPVLLEKAKVNVLTIDFEPRPLFTTSLTAYAFPEASMLHSDNIGLFSKEDEKIAVSQLYYFV